MALLPFLFLQLIFNGWVWLYPYMNDDVALVGIFSQCYTIAVFALAEHHASTYQPEAGSLKITRLTILLFWCGICLFTLAANTPHIALNLPLLTNTLYVTAIVALLGGCWHTARYGRVPLQPATS